MFGTAGTASTNLNPTKKQRRWRRVGQEESDHEQEDGRRATGEQAATNPLAGGRLENFFRSEKGTGLRISYAGAGYPLTLLVYALSEIIL